MPLPVRVESKGGTSKESEKKTMNKNALQNLHPKSEIYKNRLKRIQEQENNKKILKLSNKDINIIMKCLHDSLINGGFNADSKELIKRTYFNINEQL